MREIISSVALLLGALVITSLTADYLSLRSRALAHTAEPYQPPAIDRVQGLR
ncbi:MAG TPA: hypothetical protein VFB13_15930 [Reyranella sp.]|nr:hypothetical protein [Reyranella sp.]